jgi:uncharacterized Zn finger protein (UPF0148 family)
MKTINYHTDEGLKSFEYDENAPCIICGEPVVSASMGGTVICPWCDLGKCRYCGISVFVIKESLDDGRSKKELLDHMKWHREHPNLLMLNVKEHKDRHTPGTNMCTGLGQR